MSGPCKSVEVDGSIYTDMEEFCDHMPEGVVIHHEHIRRRDCRDCLCPIDMAATAKLNGFACRPVYWGLFVFTSQSRVDSSASTTPAIPSGT